MQETDDPIGRRSSRLSMRHYYRRLEKSIKAWKVLQAADIWMEAGVLYYFLFCFWCQTEVFCDGGGDATRQSAQNGSDR